MGLESLAASKLITSMNRETFMGLHEEASGQAWEQVALLREHKTL